MNHEQIKESIRQNMADANLEIDELRVQPDPFSGWLIAIVSPGFKGMFRHERKEIVLKGLKDLNVEWIDVLTPDERESSGYLPIDSTLEDIPLWPESLARPNLDSFDPETIVFPSDLDEDLELPIVATFYSHRGGVGRSTALAYTAQLLASRGRNVLCVDMDLEAPGLAALFGKEGEIKAEQGLVDILLALDQGERPDIIKHILRLSETDELYCLPAGVPSANYARKLALMAPEAWYREERNPLRELMNLLSNDLPFKPDVILLDARTGISSLNGPLLFDLADLAIVVFFPHPQTKVGTESLVRALLAANTKREEQPKLTPEPRFIVSPIPASRAPEVVERYEHRAIEWIRQWLAPIGEKIVDESEITHFVSYREAIATSDKVFRDRDTWQQFEMVAEWLERFLPIPGEENVSVNLSVADRKNQILEELKFSTGRAEYQENLLETFVETGLVNRALDAKISLVLGRKGSGKTAIFRRIMENPEKSSVVVFSPSKLIGKPQWAIGAEELQTIDKVRKQQGVSWRIFWMLQICLACYLSPTINHPEPEAELAQFLLREKEPTTQLKVAKLLKSLLKIDEIGLLAKDWLNRIDKSLSPQTILLFDGLDTGFGNEKEERERRARAIEGLLALVIDIGDNLNNLKFKVVLREDIWRQLAFENKSHFFGNSVTLKWENQADFLKVVIKQAIQSSTFSELAKSTGKIGLLIDNNYWTENLVLELWNLLVGERMRGGKSTFTRNWVWKRLGDGSDNRSPRTLLQLFRLATEWEKKEEDRNSYVKTIIRSRALTSSLEDVSKEALSALVKEEFTELEPLITKLKDLGRSPFEANKVNGLEEELSLALEVGLLSIYEGTKDDVKRYKVPDLYRLGIGMTRSGQA